MGEMITKPDANPIIYAVCNVFFGALGYFLMGQKKKATISAVICFVGYMFCYLPGLIWMFATVYDAWQLGQKLQAGESIGENENAVGFLDNIFKD